jgi:hypothetical protein
MRLFINKDVATLIERYVTAADRPGEGGRISLTGFRVMPSSLLTALDSDLQFAVARRL